MGALEARLFFAVMQFVRQVARALCKVSNVAPSTAVKAPPYTIPQPRNFTNLLAAIFV
ncbi:hypothetical protein LBMAG49_09430 [Planctomycetota bacterium]|nr:hypothetical protein LBMAG49_09430 [Planctomycetota bacterium]